MQPHPPEPSGTPLPRRRIALVVQRYGVEINGGAELQARQVALRLAERHDVEVLTSCALDYTDWAMHYAPGLHEVEGIRVRRFEQPLRNDIGRARVPRPHKLRYKTRKLLSLLPGSRVAHPRGDPEYDGDNFLRRQGPHCPGLLEHLVSHRADYDAAVFFTALYEPTAQGLLAWGPRSLLIPELHEEKAMYLPIFHRVFAAAGRILYNTPAERLLASGLYGTAPEAGDIAGLGIDVERPPPEAIESARTRLGLPARYLVYVGRIDTAKGCDELLLAFHELAREQPDIALVLVGQRFMAFDSDPRIHATGFIAEADRDAVVAGALALVVPSRYESLSMVLLEAMRLGVPVIANAHSQVLADHVTHSRGGRAYRSRGELVAAMRQLTLATPAERDALGSAGRTYVDAHYTWPRVMALYSTALQRIAA